MEKNLTPIYKLQNGKLLNKFEFIKYFENKVFKTIKKFSLFDLEDKIVVAVSGGKDSITVLYLVQKFLKNKNLEKNLVALVIDEGIEDYRLKTIEFLKKFCKKINVELKINSYKKKFGKTLDESLKIFKKKDLTISSCNICGTFRRNALNIGARELNATKIVTGHNLDDEAQSILLNIFKNNLKILARIGPINGIVENEKFVPRVKPLYFCTEKEVRLYTLLKGFDVGYDTCPYSKDSFREHLANILNFLEDKHTGIKNSVINFYLEIAPLLKEKYINKYPNEMTFCDICKEPSQNKICNTCKIKDILQ